ncbi:hypothetical protein ABKN59_009079 [Abortiporus biennis]
MSALKKIADSAYKAGENKQAIEFYTRAIYHPPIAETLSIEEKRVILANVQTLHQTSYKETVSPESGRASEDVQLRVSPEADDGKLKEELARGLNLRKGSKQMEKALLVRAVLNRGIIILDTDRECFPYHPLAVRGRDYDYEGDVTHFNWPISGEPITEETPISVLFSFITPFLNDPTKPGQNQNFAGTTPFTDTYAIGMFLDSWIMSFSIARLNLRENEGHQAWLNEAINIEFEERTKVFLITKNGRLLEIPRKTRAGDIYKGAKWPRTKEDGPLAFKDHITIERVNPDLVDGVAFDSGSSINLYIVPTVKVKKFQRHGGRRYV